MGSLICLRKPCMSEGAGRRYLRWGRWRQRESAARQRRPHLAAFGAQQILDHVANLFVTFCGLEAMLVGAVVVGEEPLGGLLFGGGRNSTRGGCGACIGRLLQCERGGAAGCAAAASHRRAHVAQVGGRNAARGGSCGSTDGAGQRRGVVRELGPGAAGVVDGDRTPAGGAAPVPAAVAAVGGDLTAAAVEPTAPVTGRTAADAAWATADAAPAPEDRTLELLTRGAILSTGVATGGDTDPADFPSLAVVFTASFLRPSNEAPNLAALDEKSDFSLSSASDSITSDFMCGGDRGGEGERGGFGGGGGGDVDERNRRVHWVE